jgi:hypothetical protein
MGLEPKMLATRSSTALDQWEVGVWSPYMEMEMVGVPGELLDSEVEGDNDGGHNVRTTEEVGASDQEVQEAESTTVVACAPQSVAGGEDEGMEEGVEAAVISKAAGSVDAHVPGEAVEDLAGRQAIPRESTTREKGGKTRVIMVTRYLIASTV